MTGRKYALIYALNSYMRLRINQSLRYLAIVVQLAHRRQSTHNSATTVSQ